MVFISEFNDLVAVAFAVTVSGDRNESRTVFASQGPSRAAVARARCANVLGNRGVGRNVAGMADRFFVAVKLVAERRGHVVSLAFGLIPFGTGKPRASEEVAGWFAVKTVAQSSRASSFAFSFAMCARYHAMVSAF